MTAPAGDVERLVRDRVLGAAPGSVQLDPGSLSQMVRDEAPLLSPRAVDSIVDELLADLAGLGPLETLLADPSVSDVLVQAGRPVWVERAGVLERTDIQLSDRDVARAIERVVAPLGLRADRSSPIVDARLADGSRVHAIVPPLAIDGACLAIRRFSTKPVALSSFCRDAGVASLLAEAVRGRRNILVAGGTGAGKTTLLNALAGGIPPGERIITVEDAAELRLAQEHVVRLEARPANAEGAGTVTIRSLVRAALRMRPDRIVVGECRGPEALDMLQAMNTGHEGSMSTCHANGPDDALRRLETMVLMGDVDIPLAAIREQLASALHLVVHVARADKGRRVIIEVAEVLREPHDGRRTRRVA